MDRQEREFRRQWRKCAEQGLVEEENGAEFQRVYFLWKTAFSPWDAIPFIIRNANRPPRLDRCNGKGEH